MFKILDDKCVPSKGSKQSACIDLYAAESVAIPSSETAIIPLGVSLDYDKFPVYIQNNMDSLYLQLEPRSSLRAKGIISGTGIIDIDYRDEIKIILHNINPQEFRILKGQKIAQIMLCSHKSKFFQVETNAERIGGIGSTDD